MLIVCAWCEKDGIPLLIAVRPSGHNSAVSHGICECHAALYRHARRSETPRNEKPDVPVNLETRVSLEVAENSVGSI